MLKSDTHTSLTETIEINISSTLTGVPHSHSNSNTPCFHMVKSVMTLKSSYLKYVYVCHRFTQTFEVHFQCMSEWIKNIIFNYYETKLQIKVVNKLKRNSPINIKIPYAAKYDIQYCGYNARHYPIHRSLFDAHFCLSWGN